MENAQDIDEVVHYFCLSHISGDAVKNEDIDIRFETMRIHRGIDLGFPKFHGNLVWNELTFAGVFKECAADFGAGIDRAKDVSTSAVEKARNRAEGSALGAFATARGSEKNVGLIFHTRFFIYTTRRHGNSSTDL